MLGAEIFVFQLGHHILGGIQRFAQVVPEMRLRSAGDFGAATQFRVELLAQARDGDPHFLQKWNGDAFGLVEQGQKELLVADLLLVEFAGDIRSGAERLLHLLGETVRSHGTGKLTLFQTDSQPNKRRHVEVLTVDHGRVEVFETSAHSLIKREFLLGLPGIVFLGALRAFPG